MNTIEQKPQPSTPIFAERRRVDRRQAPSPELPPLGSRLTPLPPPSTFGADAGPSPWPKGEFRVHSND